jgi:hypothetical protein
MRHKLLIVGLSILACMRVAAASPDHHGHHARHGYEAVTVARAPSFEPPRMIEARPGWWISTYDCITDEGQDRWRPC